MDVFSFELGSSNGYLVGIRFCKDICFQTLPGRGGQGRLRVLRDYQECLVCGLDSGWVWCEHLYVERAQGNISMGTGLLADPQADKTPSKRNTVRLDREEGGSVRNGNSSS